jgi:nicotinamide mononucleotide adenylyltransferase
MTNQFNPKAPTAQMLGRFQPWHQGHRAVFEDALNRVGQVCIMVRDTGGTDIKNPFDYDFVISQIEEDLKEFTGKYIIVRVPNIVDITYGRDVGYSFTKVEVGADLEAISATNIRKSMGLQ